MDRDSIARIAGLARLDLTEEEVLRLEQELGRVLKHFNTISALDPKSRDPDPDSREAGGPRREDRPDPSLPRDELMANTEHDSCGYFTVRKVIDPRREE